MNSCRLVWDQPRLRCVSLPLAASMFQAYDYGSLKLATNPKDEKIDSEITGDALKALGLLEMTICQSQSSPPEDLQRMGQWLDLFDNVLALVPKEKATRFALLGRAMTETNKLATHVRVDQQNSDAPDPYLDENKLTLIASIQKRSVESVAAFKVEASDARVTLLDAVAESVGKDISRGANVLLAKAVEQAGKIMETNLVNDITVMKGAGGGKEVTESWSASLKDGMGFAKIRKVALKTILLIDVDHITKILKDLKLAHLNVKCLCEKFQQKAPHQYETDVVGLIARLACTKAEIEIIAQIDASEDEQALGGFLSKAMTDAEKARIPLQDVDA